MFRSCSLWGCALILASASCASSSSQVSVRSFPSTPRAISELKRGWADAVVGDYPALVHTARESMGTLEVAGTQFATGFFGIGLSKQAPELKAAIEDALRRIMADQTYIEILNTWALHVGKVDPPSPAGTVPQPADV